MEQAGYWIKQGNWPTVGNLPPNLYSWGQNNYGQLGLGNTTNYSSPKQVGSVATWLNIAAGTYSTLATKTDGTLWSWGEGAIYGQLGLGNTNNYSSPKQVGALTTWLNISAGSYHGVAIKTDGTLWSWGYNSAGQLGLGTSGAASYKSSPNQVGALTTWSVVAGGGAHTLAIKTDGTLWAWGVSTFGQLGLGNTTRYSSPKQVGTLTNWLKLQCSYDFSVAIKTDGTLWSWGRNNTGQLGSGGVISRSSPVQVGALTTWSKITNGTNYTIAIKTDGTLWSWGFNGNGQLGLGNTTDYYSPKQVGALTTWPTIAAGSGHTLAVKTDGALWSWGKNDSGQLGLNAPIATYKSSPTQVGGLTTWSKIAAGRYFSIAILS
jgi:alpha-tubulin suppressor-like RCC1 family protein